MFFASFLLLASALVLAGAQPATSKVGFAFSGAGARIAQHAALMSALVNGTYPGASGPIRPVALAGASSGALSAVMLSAIIETQERGLGWRGVSMDAYKDLLFHMDSSQIYDAGIWSVTKSVIDGYVLDNTPMVQMVRSWVKRLNYKTLSDVYIPTCISVVNQDTGFTHRLWSDDPVHGKLDLVEVLMASTALPIAFQPRQITGLPGNFIDGGTGDDTLPIAPLIEKGTVNTIYAVAYGSAISSGGSGLPPPINKFKLLANALAVISDMRVDLYLAALEVAAANRNITTYSYIPKLSKTYSVLDFDHGEDEFNDALLYTVNNAPKRVRWTSLDASEPVTKKAILRQSL